MTTRNKQNAALPQYLPQAAYPTRVRRKQVSWEVPETSLERTEKTDLGK